MIVTIDGPAGSGKSTVARKLANKLGFVHLNSGSLFRALAVLATRAELRLDDEEEMSRLAEGTEFQFVLVQSLRDPRKLIGTSLLVNGQEFGEELRSSSASMLASRVAVLPKVRESLRKVQQQMAAKQSVVVEGRDAGTVVFPEAEVKFYLDADISIRAERRYAESLGAGGGELTLEAVRGEMLEREQRDLNRKEAPLRRAEDAILVDSTLMTIDEVVELMRSVVERRR